MNRVKRNFLSFAFTVVFTAIFYMLWQVNCYSRAERLNAKALRIRETDLNASCKYVRDAIKLNPSNPIFHLNLALLEYDDTKNISLDTLLAFKKISLPDSIVSCLETSYDYANNEPVSVSNLAFAYSLEGRYSDAKSILEPLIDMNHCLDEIRILYGLIQEHEGNYSEASLSYSLAIMESPIVLESSFFKELSERNPQLAQQVRNNAISRIEDAVINRNNPLDKAVLGELLFYNGDFIKADSLLNRAVIEIPSMNRPWMYLGRIAEYQEDTLSASAYYEKSSRLDANDPLPNYFLKKMQGRTLLSTEMMYEDKTFLEEKTNIHIRFGSTVLTPPFLIKGFNRYCSYDYIDDIRQEQEMKNQQILEDIYDKVIDNGVETVAKLAPQIAKISIGLPYESGLLEVIPEELRIVLDKTDNMRFIEQCLAMAITLSGTADCNYTHFCEIIQSLRYRDGKLSQYSDRIFYPSEWFMQAEQMGILKEYTNKFGHEYQQLFSYHSTNISYLPQIGFEYELSKKVSKNEYDLSNNYTYSIITYEDIDEQLIDYIEDGDILAFVSDKKGMDISDIAFVSKSIEGMFLIYASAKEKKVIRQEFSISEYIGKGFRMFRCT